MSPYPSNPFQTSRGAPPPLELKVSGPGMNGDQRYLFEHPFVLVGRQEDNALRLDDAAVSRRHAYLQQLGDRVFCVDLGSRTGTRWAGESRPAGWLPPDRGVQIGPFTLELANAAQSSGLSANGGRQAGDPLEDRINDPGPMPRFSIELGNKILSQFRMNRELALVGSAPACRVRLRDTGISRYHCSLVRTPEGVWMIDLLGGTGTSLNGRPVRCGRVNDGDQLRVGPYVLRFSYENVGAAVRSPVLPAGRTETPVQGVEEPSKPVIDVAELPAMPMSPLVPALQAELEQLRERLRDAEFVRQQLAEREAESQQLREQTRGLEIRLGEMAELKARLETAEADARELHVIRSERDHWQAEAKTVQAQLAGDISTREDLRKQLEAAQQQLEQHATDLQLVQADFAARDVEHTTVLQQLRESQEELARALDKSRENQTELEQAREHQQHAERLRQQLADTGSKHDQLVVRVLELEGRAAEADPLKNRLRDADAAAQSLRQQAEALEIQMADLKARLEAAEASASNLESVRGERDRWQTELQTAQSQLTVELAEREELRQQFAAVQQQLVEEREAVRAAQTRLDQHSADLHGVRADFASRNAEYDAAVQQLRESQDHCAQTLDKLRDLQAELDQAREHQQHAEALRQQLADSGSKHDQLTARILELEVKASEAEQLRQRLQEAEARAAELEPSSNECVRLREHTSTLQAQLAEMADVKTRLEAAEAEARELHVIRGERDQWQTDVQTLQARFAAETAEQDEVRQRLASAHAQLEEAREAVREAEGRLEQQSAALHAMRGDFAARHSEHEEASQQLQQAQDELARSIDEKRHLLEELEQTRGHQREAEELRQQLTDAVAKRDQLFACIMELEGRATEAGHLQNRLRDADTETNQHREQTQALELQLADLKSQLEAAKKQVGELADIRSERDHWQAEAQGLQNRLTSNVTEREQMDRLSADYQAIQAERDRLLTEQQTAHERAEQALARVSDLERALTEASPVPETVGNEERARWEAERQALEARVAQEREAHTGAVQETVRKVQSWAEGVIREVQARSAAEREDWRQRLEGAEAQISWERGLFQEQSEQLRQLSASLQAERDRLAARLAQVEPLLRGGAERSQDRVAHGAETDSLRQLAMRDQVLAEFCGIRVVQPFEPPARAQAPNKPAEPSRPRVFHQGAVAQGGEPPPQASSTQVVASAAPQPVAEREKPPSIPNPPARVDQQETEVTAEAGTNAVAEQPSAANPLPSAPEETAETAISSETPTNDPAQAETKQREENLHVWLSRQKDEERQGLFGKILNLVRRK